MESKRTHYFEPKESKKWWKTPTGITALFFFAGAAYFLATEHSAHVIPYLPLLIFLLCPVMHFFHHKGHQHDSTTEPDRHERSNSNDGA